MTHPHTNPPGACREHEHLCHCVLPDGHDGPHECAPDPVCGGSWWRHPDDPPGHLRVYRWPSNRPGCDRYADAHDIVGDDPPPGEYIVERPEPIQRAPRGGIRFPMPPSIPGLAGTATAPGLNSAIAAAARAEEQRLLDAMRTEGE